MAQFPGHPDDFPSLFPQPPGFVEEPWPGVQLRYLGLYLASLGCRSIVHESHYIDRDFIEDLALFHGRSLRNYENYCQRLHFFTEEISETDWRDIVTATGASHEKAEQRLQDSYLGFMVVRPLPGSPVGRTVLKTVTGLSAGGHRREFGAVRIYRVHLGSYALAVKGLAFQQQDRAVSACATTALWCAVQKVAPMEDLSVVSPAAITESASRYLLAGGRPLPSDGLTVHQICEATRAAGLSPLLIRSLEGGAERAQLLGYLSSGFAPVLALRPLKSAGDGHAVCGVGLKIGEPDPPTDTDKPFLDAQTAVKGLYIHDDRLGPYASAQLFPYTLQVGGESHVATAINIEWPDKSHSDTAILSAIVVPVPTKLRLTIVRMRTVGVPIAIAVANLLKQFSGKVMLECYFKTGVEYLHKSPTYGLTGDGLRVLTTELALSRYVGVIALTVGGSPLLDVLLDGTESGVNPAVLACVQRCKLSDDDSRELSFIATHFATRFIR